MRVIAGVAKGKRLLAPATSTTRPTLDRVKEAVFGCLQFELSNSSFLDLFGGSGGNGIEAASRGAYPVYINDVNRQCADIIRQNVRNTNLVDSITVLNKDYKVVLDEFIKEDMSFDFVYLDPPFNSEYYADAFDRLTKSALISTHGCIILEYEWGKNNVICPDNYFLRKQKKLGSCGYSIFERL